MKENFPELSNRLYFRPEIKIEKKTGVQLRLRNRSPEKFQVLEATLVDTWASTAAGAFALTENNLYTSDAFYDYLSHLTDDGVLSFTRWGFDPPRESLRLLTLAMTALGRLGESDFPRHFMVLRADEQKIKGWVPARYYRSPQLAHNSFPTDADVAKAKHELEGRSLQAIYLPGDARPAILLARSCSPKT